MTRSLKVLIVVMASLASIGSAAQAANTDLQIYQFQMRPAAPPKYLSPDAASLQAGGNANVSLLMRFCSQGMGIKSITGSGTTHSTTLNGAITQTSPANGGALTVQSTAGFPSSGTVQVDTEQISYTGTTATSFTGITRAVFAQAHANGAPVIQPDPYVVTTQTTTLSSAVSLNSTTLNGAITTAAPADGGALTVSSTAGFPPTGGTLKVDAELISYSGTTSTTFTGITRGANGTGANNHFNGAKVILNTDTLPVVDTTGFQPKGTILVDSEQFSYTGITSNSFTGVIRGAISTIPAAHAANATVIFPHPSWGPPGLLKVVGANPASFDGMWHAKGNGFDPGSFQLVDSSGRPTQTPDLGNNTSTALAPGPFVQFGGFFGCTPAATPGADPFSGSRLREFTLQLPSGFVGNPTAAEACPESVWIAGACPDSSIVGFSLSEVIPTGSVQFTTPPTPVPTEIYNVQTMGLKPAALGTRILPSTPVGPFSIVISVRTSGPNGGDYGINSALFGIPKNLGGPLAEIEQIDTVLCAQVPCKPTNPNDPHTVQPNPLAAADGKTKPFFRNPTDCAPKTAKLTAISWAADPALASADSKPNFTPTGCDNVPFSPKLTVTPSDTQAGAADAQKVSIDYGGNYVNDQIWQAALNEANVTLPDGMSLSPGGGTGLEGCDYQQFGVSAPDSQGNHHQLNDDAPNCPAGSQIGTLTVQTPVLPAPLPGKVFFGCNRTSSDQPCLTTPGRPTPDKPWKLFLYIQGAGLRIKLAGDVDVCGPMDQPHPAYCKAEGQIHNLFKSQPEVPFQRLDLNLNGGSKAVIANPNDCNAHTGDVTLKGWNGVPNDTPNATSKSAPTITPTGCAAVPFAPKIDSAGSNPDQAGANTTSSIVISRTDGQDDIKNIKLSLPVGAVGSLAAAPECPIAQAQAGSCSADSKIGTVKTTVGTKDSLLTTAGSLYLAEPSVPGDAATLALVVPARAGPIDLGQVVVLNRVMLRPSDTGVDAVTSDVPNIFSGVPLHVRKIEISVDRPGFFLNPTGCEPRPLTATFTGYGGEQSTSTMMLAATGCDKLPFGPKLRLIAGAKGQNAQFDHPPLRAIVTQTPAEANIKSSQVILPDLLRPNAVEFNVPGGLCTDTQFSQGACPKLSEAGSANVITPVLPFQLAGPVYVVQEAGSVLPKLYVVLRGHGLEVVLRARNSFLHAIQTINTFDNLPDVPQSRFELDIRGGPGGILNNFYDACGVAAQHRSFDYSFTGQNGKTVKQTAMLEQEGCVSASSARASIASRTIKVLRNGTAKVRVRCLASSRCKGRLAVSAKGVKASKSFSIAAHRSQALKLKFSKTSVSKLRKARRMKGRAVLRLGGKSIGKSITLRAA